MTKFKRCTCRAILTVFCTAGLLLPGISQVVITAQLPPGGMIQKEQLWNLSVFNNNSPFEMSIQLTLQDALTGQLLMSANTGNISLAKGVKILSNSTVQPVIYDNAIAMRGNYLPLGTYIVCYQINTMRGDVQQTVSNECMKMNIDPLSPPLLSFPADKSKIDNPYPTFAWMPPAPVDMFTDLNYDIIVSEVLEGQSPAEAIENNMPVYTGNHLAKTNEVYPTSFAKLDIAKTYAWQVIAKNNESYAAKTAVWTFTINNGVSTVTPPTTKNYLLIENNLNDTYMISARQLNAKYMSFDKDHVARIVFSNAKGVAIFSINKKIVQGDNYFDLALNSRFEKGRRYTVTITDMSGKSKALNFSIQ